MQFYTPTCDVPDRALGGKAAGLRALNDAGYPIPAWFVIPNNCYSPSGIDGDDAAAMVAAARKLAGNGLLAVRSSACDEDGARMSFAGQFESVLAVAPENVPAAVERVWRSAYDERAVRYRREHALPAPVAPAVLIQKQLDPDVAGVAFSVDPVGGYWDQALVSAVPGCGTALVNGDVDADVWHLERAGNIVRREIAHKTRKHTLCAQSRNGVDIAPVAATDADAPCLSDAQVREVAAMTRQLACLRKAPQDIEFAFTAGTLHLLQSRAITTLGTVADPHGTVALWDNANIAESYGGLTSPLTYSFARHAYEHVYRQFCRLLGVNEATINANGHVFGSMIGLVQGRVYYNLLNWHRLLALLPGYQRNRTFMEQMMGVDEALANELAPSVTPPRSSRWRDLMRLARTGLGLIKSFAGINRAILRFEARLDTALAAPVIALTEQRIDELAAHYRMLESRLLTRWDAPLTNDLLAMIFYGLTRALAARWLGDATGTLQNDLIGGEGGIISTEPAAHVQRMAQTIRDDPALIEKLAKAPVIEILRCLKTRPELEQQYRDYLQRFGDRCLDELKLESLSLDDDPEPLFRSIAAFAQSRHEESSRKDTSNHALTARAKAEARVGRELRNPLKRAAFNWCLKHARARVRCRENLRFERTRLFGQVRRVVTEMGKRLAACNKLDDARDVFYLELNELLGFIEGTSTCTDLDALAGARKQQYTTFAANPEPANRFRTTGAVHIGNTFSDERQACEFDHGNARVGTGACPGIVRGPARVVRDPRGITLEPGTVLVAQRTDPGWIMLFPAAAGLVVERGSLLSHSAIVARELGLPTVVGVNGATTWIADGDLIELDGTTGHVRKVG